MEKEPKVVDILSIDPGIRNLGVAHVRATIHPGSGRRKTEYGFEVIATGQCSALVGDDEKPLEMLRAQKTHYLAHLLDRLFVDQELPLYQQFKREHNGIVVVEENDNKYTGSLAPAIVGKLHRHNFGNIHMVKPQNVWNSMKKQMGWQKGMKVQRKEKKNMTRQFLLDQNLLRDCSDDVNDAVLNALYFARKANKKS